MDRDQRGLESRDSGVTPHLRSLLMLPFLPTPPSLPSPLFSLDSSELSQEVSPELADEPRPTMSMFSARAWEIGESTVALLLPDHSSHELLTSPC